MTDGPKKRVRWWLAAHKRALSGEMPHWIRWNGLAECALGRVTLAGTIPCSKGTLSTGPLRYWPNPSLIHIIGGRAAYSDERGRQRILAEGDLFLIVPEVRHHFVPHGGASFAENFLGFNGPVFDALRTAKAIDAERPFYHLRPVAAWERRFAEIHQGQARGEADSLRRIGALVRLITDIAAVREGVSIDADAEWLARARAALRAAELRHAPERAAATLGVSYASFRKRFARLSGMPPARYRMRCALDHAAALLAEGDVSVSEIAAQVGFTDPYGFSRRFRAELGAPPSAYRKRGAH